MRPDGTSLDGINKIVESCDFEEGNFTIPPRIRLASAIGCSQISIGILNDFLPTASGQVQRNNTIVDFNMQLAQEKVADFLK